MSVRLGGPLLGNHYLRVCLHLRIRSVKRGMACTAGQQARICCLFSTFLLSKPSPIFKTVPNKLKQRCRPLHLEGFASFTELFTLHLPAGQRQRGNLEHPCHLALQTLWRDETMEKHSALSRTRRSAVFGTDVYVAMQVQHFASLLIVMAPC